MDVIVERNTSLLLLKLLILCAAVARSECFAVVPTSSTSADNAVVAERERGPYPLQMSLLSDLGDALSGGKLCAQSSLPYAPPLCRRRSVGEAASSFAVRERGLSLTGEDYDVHCPERRSAVVRVRGAMLHLPGKDKLRIESARDDDDDDDGFEEVAVLDRVLMTMSPTYDVYRGGMGAEKIGWIEKKTIALTDTFDVYMEGKGGVGPFKPPPAYQITGNFLERNFVMKNDKGEVVAKAFKDGIFQFDAFNHYQVQVAPGMDAVLVLACTCAIDEEMDEEHKEKLRKEKEKEEKGGWF